MKFSILLPTVLFVLIFANSCTESSNLRDGRFYTDDNDIFYGIEVLNNQSEIRFYISKEWSNLNSEEELKEQKNWKHYRSGIIVRDGNQLLVSEVESDIPPFQREQIVFTIKKEQLIIDCDNLYNGFSGQKSYPLDNSSTLIGNPPCKAKTIVFKIE